MTALHLLVQAAIARRAELLSQLAAENSDCYRLFHGSNEGAPGLTVDRYGPMLLIQSFHASLDQDQLREVETACSQHFEALESVYRDRSKKKSADLSAEAASAWPDGHVGHEIGVKYRVGGRHEGQDPLLFLDMRVGRRRMLELSAGKSVLNLFAYTCGLGVCAALAGATEVWNIDFAARNLAVGEENARLNQLDSGRFKLIKSDYFTAVRQLAGLPVSQRRQQGSRGYEKFSPRSFDLVFLDPPRWAKSPFGTVDLIRDYASVLKPALLATAPGGTLICTNNVAAVPLEDWLDGIQRSARKAGRPVQNIEILTPEADFPSPDGQYPLKIAQLLL